MRIERERRFARYAFELTWALDAGLHPAQGFRGLRDQLGPNPEVDELHEALTARVAALPPDPWAEEAEPAPLLLVA